MIKSFSQQSYTQQHLYICVYAHCALSGTCANSLPNWNMDSLKRRVRLVPCGWPRGHPNAMNWFSHLQCMWGSWRGADGQRLGACMTSKSPGCFLNGGFSPKSSIFKMIFHYKPIHFGVPLFLETPKYCWLIMAVYNVKPKSTANLGRYQFMKSTEVFGNAQ